MPKRGYPPKYVSVEYKVWPNQNKFIRALAKARDIPINEAARQVFAHAMTCPLFDRTGIDTSLVSE